MRVLLILLLVSTALRVDAQQMVLQGDHPDPSVVKIGTQYWATATSSNWMPAFPILSSTDLVHWQQKASVFMEAPEWSDYYFWAPEISYDKGRVWIYYSAHKKNGNLCVAAASAASPEGPYTDHGPLICQAVGSIDAFATRDESGKLYMIWKEDGNSVGKPTPIWAQEMNEDRTAMLGEPKELFRNDQPWEANLVEGVSMIRHGAFFYAFYAAAGCCGSGCSYVMGVARSNNLLGPWEKMKSPLFTGDADWKCPGHGTPVERNGRFYLLYHAYAREGGVYLGREGLLSEFRFGDDGWVSLVPTDTTAQKTAAAVVMDDFNGKDLGMGWEWSVFNKPLITLKDGILEMKPDHNAGDVYIGQRVLSSDYEVTTTLESHNNFQKAGIALIGDDKHLLYMVAGATKIEVHRRENGKDSLLTSMSISVRKSINLRMTVRNGREVSWSFSFYKGVYTSLNVNADAAYLPPWDRSLRAGILVESRSQERALTGQATPDSRSPKFYSFRIKHIANN